jgi:hypothetical protein
MIDDDKERILFKEMMTSSNLICTVTFGEDIVRAVASYSNFGGKEGGASPPVSCHSLSDISEGLHEFLRVLSMSIAWSEIWQLNSYCCMNSKHMLDNESVETST